MNYLKQHISETYSVAISNRSSNKVLKEPFVKYLLYTYLQSFQLKKAKNSETECQVFINWNKRNTSLR